MVLSIWKTPVLPSVVTVSTDSLTSKPSYESLFLFLIWGMKKSKIHAYQSARQVLIVIIHFWSLPRFFKKQLSEIRWCCWSLCWSSGRSCKASRGCLNLDSLPCYGCFLLFCYYFFKDIQQNRRIRDVFHHIKSV